MTSSPPRRPSAPSQAVVLNSVAIGFIFDTPTMFYNALVGKRAASRYESMPPLPTTALALPGTAGTVCVYARSPHRGARRGQAPLPSSPFVSAIRVRLQAHTRSACERGARSCAAGLLFLLNVAWPLALYLLYQTNASFPAT